MDHSPTDGEPTPAAGADERPAPTPGLFSSDVLIAGDVDGQFACFGEP